MRIPKLRRHTSGLGTVRLNGTDLYSRGLRWPESQEEAPEPIQTWYDRLIAEWLASGRGRVKRRRHVTVEEIIAAYWLHVETYYRRPDGSQTTEVDEFRRSLKIVRKLYGELDATDFGPRALKAVRQAMISEGWSRGVINQRTRRVVRMFKWAVEDELVPASVHDALELVPGIPIRRMGVRETDPVKPVANDLVEATLPLLTRPVRAMVLLQLASGMRPGEACAMRGIDLTMTGDVWVYRPPQHKTAWRGWDKEILLGKQAQAVIRDWLRTNLEENLFQPRDAVPNRKLVWGKPLGKKYTTVTYAGAIDRACEKGELEHWSPNQLRHNVGTKVRKLYGLEGAQLVLGHSWADVTQLYAERDLEKAKEIVRAIG